MLCIYVELRYQRQLNRICPDVLADFFARLSASALSNGGRELKAAGGVLFQLEDASIGFAFAASRILADVRELLERHRSRIREYLVLVDLLPTPLTADGADDWLAPYAREILSDQGVFLTPSANRLLAAYMQTKPLEGVSLRRYCGSKITEYDRPAKPLSGSLPNPLILFTPCRGSPISAFRNLAYANPLPALEPSPAMRVFSEYRFAESHPDYLVTACDDWLEAAFQEMARTNDGPVPVSVFGIEPLPADWQPLLTRLDPYCRFSYQPAPAYLPTDFTNLPRDLLDLAYLLVKAGQFLYVDELAGFFLHLGKQPDFLAELGKWLYSFGFLASPDNLLSVKRSLTGRIVAELGDDAAKLDRLLAGYLWALYERGALQPDVSLLEVFGLLRFTASDGFRVSCLYRRDDPQRALAEARPAFRNPSLADAVDRLECARKAAANGSVDEAAIIARNVLHLFQQEKILPGEYRALTLIAFLAHCGRKGGDASVYLEYALENAMSMHDALCVMRTRFDMAVSHFCTGNFHFALCSLDTVDRLAEAAYERKSEVMHLFLRGRIAFELGDCENSSVLFQAAASAASVLQFPEPVPLCRAWYGRSLAHLGRYVTAAEILDSCVGEIPEAQSFALEAELLSGRFESSRPIAERIETFPGASDICSPEQPIWKSGFTMAEDRCSAKSGGQRLAGRFHDAFRRYRAVRSGVSTDTSGAIAAIAELARYASDADDPYAGVYYYLCYDLGSYSESASAADNGIYLSKAFKYLQKRANEIGDNNMREQYMMKPVWNGRLYHAAKKNMLI